ncbi:MAG: Fe-S cluster assembly protein SufD [Microthrixaceae bacterium]
MAPDSFTIDVADALGGPDWLRRRRVAAAEIVGSTSMPTTAAEVWRYSRVGDLDTARYAPLPTEEVVVDDDPGSAQVPTTVRRLLDDLGDVAGVVVLHDGRVVVSYLDPSVAADGVVFGLASAGPEGVLGEVLSTPSDLFSAWNDAFAPDPVVIDVPRSVDVALPLVVVHHVDAAGSLTLPRLAVRVGENASVSIIEASYSADVEALVVPVTEISVGAAARVRHASLQDLGPKVWQLGTFVAEVGQDATIDAGIAALGGSYARTRIDCRLVGRGATGNLSSVYFGDDDQMLDLRTFQEHRAPDTTSNLLFKGAVADRSHSVYTGLIRITPEGRGSNAFQTNRNLKLSEDAWAESVPNLEIEHNDVHCSHASTVGPVDEEQRFYLESRGVPSNVAERLVVAGFFREVIDALAVPALAPAVRRRVDELLDRQVGAIGAIGDDARAEVRS